MRRLSRGEAGGGGHGTPEPHFLCRGLSLSESLQLTSHSHLATVMAGNWCRNTEPWGEGGEFREGCLE